MVMSQNPGPLGSLEQLVNAWLFPQTYGNFIGFDVLTHPHVSM